MGAANNGGPAFPVHGGYEGDDPRNLILGGGMTLRDYFAANSPIGVADANEVFYRANSRNASIPEMLTFLADLRGAYADAMLTERAK